MKIGMALANQFKTDTPFADEIQAVVEEVRLANELGFDAILAGEHRLSVPYAYCAPFPFLARLSAEAPDMHLVAMNLAPLHNPVDTAEQGATLDAISRGKFILAAALGYREIEYEAFGVDQKKRVGVMLEALELLQRLWTEPEIEFEGKYFRLPRTQICTRPTREGGPPIWLAANNDRAVERAAKHGFPWLLNPHATVETLKRQQVAYEEAARAAGKQVPEDAPIIREVIVDEDPNVAWEYAEEFLGGKYKTYAKWGQDKTISAEEDFTAPFKELAQGRFIIGTPDDCLREVEKLKAAGVNWIFIHCHWPGMDHERTKKTIRLFGDHVLQAARG